MLVQPRRILIASLFVGAVFATVQSAVRAETPRTLVPKLGLAFTELPTSIKEIRFVFECEDGLEIETRWIAQNVGDAAPANYEIGKMTMVTRGPLNVTSFSRPNNGWPLGLYRLELWHNTKLFHTEYYVIEDLESGAAH